VFALGHRGGDRRAEGVPAEEDNGWLTSLSCLLGAGVLNNTFCLGIFLALVYFKRLAWEFTAETVAIVVIEFAVGLVVLQRENLRMAHGFFILALYPLSLALVWFLKFQFGWD